MYILLGLLLMVFVSTDKISSDKVSFTNYKVYRLTPTIRDHFHVLHNLRIGNASSFSFWKEPTFVSRTADLMVAPEHHKEFEKLMELSNMQYTIQVEDVQALIDKENAQLVRAGSFDWTRYHTLDEIYDWLDKLAETNRTQVKIVIGGRSYENNTIKGVHLSFRKGNPGVFLEGGIHGREWISPATVTYLLDQFLTNNNLGVRKIIESFDWYIFPVVNPDGFKYTHTTNRLWRKTRSLTRHPKCIGVDANRNWNFKWNTGGASHDPCSETYGGRRAFSVTETLSLSNYLKKISHKLFAYISFHSYSQVLAFPYGHTKRHLDNYNDLKTIGELAVQSLKTKHGTTYSTGSISETLYIVSGSSADWAKGVLKLPIVYVYELRDTGKYGFLLPPDQIIPTGEEVLQSLLDILLESRMKGYDKYC